jgi:hypothetical protein
MRAANPEAARTPDNRGPLWNASGNIVSAVMDMRAPLKRLQESRRVRADLMEEVEGNCSGRRSSEGCPTPQLQHVSC